MLDKHTIAELQKGLLAHDYSCVDLVDYYLERIKRLDKKLNAFITVTENEAYEQAKRNDELLKNYGKDALIDNPLLGVVVSYKDLFLTKGVRTTAGSKVLETYIPQYDATVVKRINEAGAIMIGKTNCDAWGHGSSGEHSAYGFTKNPHNTEYVPGGSSSGSAVSVMSGMSFISTGTDTGSSVRQPANFCGIAGIKPTYGVIPRYGIISMASSLDTIGSFALTIKDVEKVFDVMKGYDGKDATVIKNPNFVEKKEKYVLGIPKEYFVDGVDAEVKNKVMEAVEIYQKNGFEIKEVSIPHTKYALDVYYIITPAEISSNLGRYDSVRFGNKRNTFGNEAVRRIMLGTYVLSSGYYDAYYKKASQVRSLLISEFDKVFEDVDALIAPVSPTPPFKIGENASDPLKMYLADIFTVSANIVGIPGLSVPFGFTKNKLPLGFQLMGPRFSEYVLFDIGSKFHQFVNYKPTIVNG